MSSLLFGVDTFRAIVRMTTALILIASGGFIMLRAGITNVALEGLVLAGSCVGIITSIYFGNVWFGILLTLVIIIVINLLYTLLVIKFKTNEIVAGLAINILVSGITIYTYQINKGNMNLIQAGINILPKVNIVLLEKFPIFNDLFNNYCIFVYLTILLVILLEIIIYHSPLGYYIRAAGESAEALKVAGIESSNIRYITALFCGLLVGLGGTYLSIGYVNEFTPGMSGGRGWIALAVIFIANREYKKLVVISVIFVTAEAIAFRLQLLGFSSYLVLTFPYIITILLMLMASLLKKTKIIKRG